SLFRSQAGRSRVRSGRWCRAACIAAGLKNTFSYASSATDDTTQRSAKQAGRGALQQHTGLTDVVLLQTDLDVSDLREVVRGSADRGGNCALNRGAALHVLPSPLGAKRFGDRLEAVTSAGDDRLG